MEKIVSVINYFEYINMLDFLRQFRLGDLALFDFAVAFLGMFLMAPLLSGIFRRMGLEIPKRNWLYLTLPIGLIVHMLIGRITPMTKLFLNPSGHYFLKAVILGLFILGLRGIKKTK